MEINEKNNPHGEEYPDSFLYLRKNLYSYKSNNFKKEYILKKTFITFYLMN